MPRPVIMNRASTAVLAVGISLLLTAAAGPFPIPQGTEVTDRRSEGETTPDAGDSAVDRGSLGFSGRTLWEYLEVFGVPLVLALVSGGFGLMAIRAGRRTEQERRLEADRARAASLRDYLDFMTRLIREQKLRGRRTSRAVKALAHARTFGALRGLDGARKGILVRFLYESELVTTGREVISLDSADLRDVDLAEASLASVHLAGSILDRATFQGAYLQQANFGAASLTGALFIDADMGLAQLRDAQLTGARLDNADLSKANLSYAVLEGASLREAILIDADLSHAKLSGANLSGADMSRSNLTECDLRRADLLDVEVDDQQLQEVEDLEGAHMPDGSRMTASRWAEFRHTNR